MDKIFEPEVEKYLLETGMTKKQINQIKFRKAKEATLKTISKATHFLANDNYEKLEKLLFYSPAGDEMGIDTNYIDFSDCIGTKYADLGTVVSFLKLLKKK